MPQFNVKLVQNEWITTEIFPFEAKTEEDALKLAQDFVDEHKDLKDRKYRLEAEEVQETVAPETDGDANNTTTISNVPDADTDIVEGGQI